jgi:hypothetical protein
MKIIAVPAREVPFIFGSIVHLIQAALDYGPYETTVDDVYADIVSSKNQLWVLADERYRPVSVYVTEVIDYPRKSIVRVLLLSGSGFLPFTELTVNALEQLAHRVGATAIEVIGRKGWERHLKPFGFNSAYVHLIKEL